jgi:hypothetical protein
MIKQKVILPQMKADHVGQRSRTKKVLVYTNINYIRVGIDFKEIHDEILRILTQHVIIRKRRKEGRTNVRKCKYENRNVR